MKYVLALALSCATVTSAFAAPAPQAAANPGTTTTTTKKAARKTASVSKQLDELKSEMRQAIEAQQQQIQLLRQELQTRDQAVQQLQQRLDQSQATATEAQGKANAATAQVTQEQQAVTDLRSDVSDIKQNSTNTALSLQDTQKTITDLESPLALHYKGITITPGGFLAAESVWRQHALASDINTPFNAIPFAGAPQSNLSEFFGSGRQSRISMLAEGKLKNVKLTGYVEADFLSAGVTSNNNESNSYTLRQRQAWGQAALQNGFSFTGGQMWSLVTETRNGVDNRTEALPMTIDPQYNIGFSWARQYGFRVAKKFGNKFWLAASVENPQATLTAHGNANNFVLGAAGTSGGLYNPSATYAFNPSPDFVFKAAAQPSTWSHFEVFGLISDFRDRTYPCATTAATSSCLGVVGPSAAGVGNHSTTGWGIGANGRVSLLNKHLDAGLHFLSGDGIGRYGTVTLPDTTVRPDGTLALVKSTQALATLEAHGKKFDIYANVGGEYAGRRSFFTSTGSAEGYGAPGFKNSGCFTELPPGTPTSGQFPVSSNGFLPTNPANCTGDTRNELEGTLGFWYRFYKGPKGTIQWGPQFSYIVRNTWEGVAGPFTSGEPSPVERMLLTSFRYYLP
jgi:TolA-binding protein